MVGLEEEEELRWDDSADILSGPSSLGYEEWDVEVMLSELRCDWDDPVDSELRSNWDDPVELGDIFFSDEDSRDLNESLDSLREILDRPVKEHYQTTYDSGPGMFQTFYAEGGGRNFAGLDNIIEPLGARSTQSLLDNSYIDRRKRAGGFSTTQKSKNDLGMDTSVNDPEHCRTSDLWRSQQDQIQPGKPGLGKASWEKGAGKTRPPQCEGEPLNKLNLGYKLLMNMGWVPGLGLGPGENGIQYPIGAMGQKSREGFGVLSPLQIRDLNLTKAKVKGGGEKDEGEENLNCLLELMRKEDMECQDPQVLDVQRREENCIAFVQDQVGRVPKPSVDQQPESIVSHAQSGRTPWTPDQGWSLRDQGGYECSRLVQDQDSQCIVSRGQTGQVPWSPRDQGRDKCSEFVQDQVNQVPESSVDQASEPSVSLGPTSQALWSLQDQGAKDCGLEAKEVPYARKLSPEAPSFFPGKPMPQRETSRGRPSRHKQVGDEASSEEKDRLGRRDGWKTGEDLRRDQLGEVVKALERVRSQPEGGNPNLRKQGEVGPNQPKEGFLVSGGGNQIKVVTRGRKQEESSILSEYERAEGSLVTLGRDRKLSTIEEEPVSNKEIKRSEELAWETEETITGPIEEDSGLVALFEKACTGNNETWGSVEPLQVVEVEKDPGADEVETEGVEGAFPGFSLDLDDGREVRVGGGARPKVKSKAQDPNCSWPQVIDGDITDPRTVNEGDVIINYVDAVSEEGRGIDKEISEKLSYADVYARRKARRACVEEPVKIDNLLTKFGEPGSVVWDEPGRDQKGPAVATCIVQFCFGRPADRAGEQERILQVGVGSAMTRQSLYGDISKRRARNIEACFALVLKEVGKGKGVQRVLIPEDMGRRVLGGERGFYEMVENFTRQLSQKGVRAALVRQPREGEWELGPTSVSWLQCDGEDPVCTYSEEGDEGGSLGRGNLISYFADINIANTKVRALVDCGASCSVLSAAVVSSSGELADRCQPTSKTIRGVGNHQIPMLGIVTSGVSIGEMEATLNFAVVEADRLPVSAIIGNDFLHTYGVVIDMGAGMLTVGGRTIKLIPKYAKNRRSKFKANFSETIQIPPRSKILVVAQTDATCGAEDAGVYLDPARTDDSESLFGRSVSDIQNGEILVPVLNPSLVSVKIEKGDLAGDVYILPTGKVDAVGQFEEGYLAALLDEAGEMDDLGSDPAAKRPSELYDLTGVGEGLKELTELLDSFPEITSFHDYDIGDANLPPMVIDTGDSSPVSLPQRRMAPLQKQKVGKHIEAMVGAGILRHSTSAWSSQLVPVAKRDGDVRPCVDLRGLNRVTKFNAFPLPNMDDLLSSLKGSRVYSTLDLNKGFHQLKIDGASTKKTAFSFNNNHLEYTRVAFGLTNAPGFFQKMMQVVLSGIGIEEVIIYIDDFLVHTSSVEKHLEVLRKVFSRLKTYGLKIKPQKCRLMQSKVSYLGHEIKEEGITPLEARIGAIVNYPRPSTPRQCKRFTGMISFYRSHLPHLSSLLRPLTQAQSKPKLEWTEECQTAFEESKKLITRPPILAFPDYRVEAPPFILTSDGSGIGVGAYLAQKQGEVERVIGYFSKVFNDNQSKLSATDKELEGLRLATQFFRPHIVGRQLVLRTDHRPIVDMAKAKHLNARLFRIYELLSTLNITVEYIPGRNNRVSDALSRLEPAEEIPVVREAVVLPAGTRESEVPGGGDSLVRAFAKTFLLDEGRHQEVRRRVIKEIRKNPKKYGFNDTSLKGLRRWEIEGEPLPIEILEPLGEAYCVKVVVYQAGTLPMKFGPEKGRNTVNLVWRDAVHFNAVAEEGSLCQEVCVIDEQLEPCSGAGPTQGVCVIRERPELRIWAGSSRDQIRGWQESDPQLKFFKRAVEGGRTYEEVKGLARREGIQMPLRLVISESRVTEGILARTIQLNGRQAWVPWLPREIASSLIEEGHRSLSHVGESKMYDFARSYCYVNNLQEEVAQVVGKCQECKMAKPSNGANKAPFKEIRTSRPYELVALDLAQFPRSKRGNCYLFLGIDHYSKRAVGRPIKDKSARTIATEFEYTFLPSFVTVPERLLSDNGGEFSNRTFSELMDKYKIEHHTIAPGYPASNGAIERLVGTLKTLLRAACMGGREWDDEFPVTLNAYNNTKHRTLSGKPSEVFLANAARVVMPKQTMRQGSAQQHNPYREGDRVLKKVDVPASKASPRYEPGFTIVRVNPANMTYVVRRANPGPGQLTLLKAHHNQLKYLGSGPVDPEPSQEEGRVASAVITLRKLSQVTCRVEKSCLTTPGKGTKVGRQPMRLASKELVSSTRSTVARSESRVQGNPPGISRPGPSLIPPTEVARVRIEQVPHVRAAATADLVEALGPPGERQVQGPERQIRRSVRSRSQPKYLEYYHLGKQ